MYRRESKSWVKHVDFMILDLFCAEVALWIAYGIHTGGWGILADSAYRELVMIIFLVDVISLLGFATMKNVLKRSKYQEFVVTIGHTLTVGAITAFCLLFKENVQQYSRVVLILSIVLYTILSGVTRFLWKKLVAKKMATEGIRSLIIVSSSDVVESVVENIREFNYQRFRIAGIAVIDQDMREQKIHGIPVVATMDTVAMYICKNWIDEVLVVTSEKNPCSQTLLQTFMSTGVTVHQSLHKMFKVYTGDCLVENIGVYPVLTASMKQVSTRQLFVKRVIDIAAGLAGTLMTGVIFLFVAPLIYINSPGPIFFGQERVGKNGKIFKMYKFRSMYMDAEERKAELMKYNRVSDGRMFKLDFDPRVIGNKILPDGTKKTGIGNFIRVTSLDEFPQFFNVLKGDMSLIGTRPPLISEVSEYEFHHRARLAIKPGITGMWQVSGRSDITDFEEVVKLDTEYIRNWSIGLDFKILLKTVLVVLKKDGSM